MSLTKESLNLRDSSVIFTRQILVQIFTLLGHYRSPFNFIYWGINIRKIGLLLIRKYIILGRGRNKNNFYFREIYFQKTRKNVFYTGVA